MAESPRISYLKVNGAARAATGEVGKAGTKENSRPDVLLFQQGLQKVVGLDYSSGPGIFGPATKAATTKFQRSQGWSGAAADGIPGPETCRLLADESGLFKVVDLGAAPGGRVPSPCPGHKVTHPFGVRNARYAAGYHTGDDYAAPTGAKLVAVRPGTVEFFNGGAYGKVARLRADNGRDYWCCHMERNGKAGRVKAGDVIGYVGTTGNVTGPHLHFEDRPRNAGYGHVRKPQW